MWNSKFIIFPFPIHPFPQPKQASRSELSTPPRSVLWMDPVAPVVVVVVKLLCKELEKKARRMMCIYIYVYIYKISGASSTRIQMTRSSLLSYDISTRKHSHWSYKQLETGIWSGFNGIRREIDGMWWVLHGDRIWVRVKYPNFRIQNR